MEKYAEYHQEDKDEELKIGKIVILKDAVPAIIKRANEVQKR